MIRGLERSLRRAARAAGAGRLVMVAIGGVAAAWLVASALNGPAAWDTFGVDASGSFMDLRHITGGWDCIRHGYDVMHVNPCDRWARPMNYPWIWMLPSWIGLGAWATAGVGIAFAILFVAAVLLVAGRITAADGAVYAVVLVSPAVMLGVERTNADLLIFALLAVSALLAARDRTPLAAAVLLLAAMLKLYPLFALPLLLGRRRGSASAAGVVVGFCCYMVAIRHQLAVIENQSSSDHVSFGLHILFEHNGIGSRTTEGLVAAALLVAGCAIAAVARGVGLAVEHTTERNLVLFRAGASVYVGVYLILGNNFAYRLVVLLLVLPQLIDWARDRRLRPIAAPFLLATVLLPVSLSDRWGRLTGPLGIQFRFADALALLLALLFTSALAFSFAERLLPRRLGLERAAAVLPSTTSA